MRRRIASKSASNSFCSFSWTLPRKSQFRRLARRDLVGRQVKLWVKSIITWVIRMTKFPSEPSNKILPHQQKKNTILPKIISIHELKNSKPMVVIFYHILALFEEWYPKIIKKTIVRDRTTVWSYQTRRDQGSCWSSIHKQANSLDHSCCSQAT